MLDKARRTVISFVAVYSLLQPFNLHAVELGAFGNSVFQFQKKMAAKGNTSAEYKLGTLYEFGISVKPDVKEASNYYKRAAKKGYQPAINRLTYLEIKQSGYNKSKHDTWFKNLSSQAASSEPNALILLGQMHRHGINVEKNLNKSLAMLQKANALGHTEVDSQIDEIYRELEAKAELRDRTLNTQTETTNKAPTAVKPKPKKAKPVKVSKSKPVVAKKKRSKSSEAKRRKYEEAMRKLYQESLIMQQQQEWSEEE